MSAGVTVMVFTLDEEKNLPACLDSLRWCDDVIVVDSFSKDATERVSRERGARFVQHAFTGFGDQRNWAFDHASPRHDWVLVLDADERVPAELAEEIARAVRSAPEDAAAFRLRRRFHFHGRWLRRSALYPTWVVRLIRMGRVRYVNRGHAETQEVSGRIFDLVHDLIDENLKGDEFWWERQRRYAEKEAAYELERRAPGWSGLFSADPLVRRAALKGAASNLPFRGAAYFLYSYVLRGGFLEGSEGLRFCRMKAAYQRMIADNKKRMRKAA